MTDHAGTPDDRQSAIRRLLSEQGRVDVAEVAGLLGVAQETVRRDLRALESAGVLRRVHGGAIAVETDTVPPIATLAAPDPDEMALATQLWAELPRTGTILIGNGILAPAVTYAIMAAAPDVPGLTVVTNSLDAAVQLARIPRLSVYNIGGTVSHETRAQEGDWAIEELSRLRVDIALLSPAGVSVEHGLSESTPAAAAVAQAQLRCAEQRLVLCPASVLGRSAFVRYAALTEVDRLLVSGRPDPMVARSFYDEGVQVEAVGAEPAMVGSDHVRMA